MDPADFRPHNFLALPSEFSEIQSSKFVILPVPYEQTTTFKAGAKEGPQAIINASQEVETFDEELKQETFKVGIHTLGEMEITMGGPEKMVEKIYQIAKELVDMPVYLCRSRIAKNQTKRLGHYLVKWHWSILSQCMNLN